MIESMNGGKVWLPCPENGWTSGEIIDETAETIIAKDENGKEVNISRADLKMQNPSIQEGIDDMTNLSYLHEPAVVHNLIRRYELNTIYTYTGTILIAINPYCKLSLYTKEMIDSFCDQPIAKLPPHVYAIAEASYREMLNHQKNQSILVSGESGAGKTESTKFLLQYFAAMGEKMGQSQQETAENNNIESQVIKSTPILEAFGNAKTLRNDNSSRFGKFIQIHFEKSRGTIVGAYLETYLLEKSRIVKPPQNERSFHIFYQFLLGVSEQTRAVLHTTTDPLDFYYLSQSGCHEIDEVDDKKVFEKTEKALRVVGFTDDDLLGVWKILAAILHCGNIQFKEKDENTAELIETSTIQSTSQEYSPLSKVCQLLGCNIDTIKNTLLQRQIKAGNESYTIPLTLQQANDARDSLSMYLYSRLFDWLVYRINQSIDKKKKDYLFIGILDIYGFESFEQNSFEQFTINYANEKLQNQFNHQIFKLEQQEYDKEKIDWSYIEFNDNQDCIDLIEKKPLGILSILDEETQFPKATPATLSTKLYSNHQKTKHFEKPRFSNIHFTIDHYAGKVDYDTTLFLDKNKDFIIPEQVMALNASNSDFFKKVVATSGATAADQKKSGTSSAGSGRLIYENFFKRYKLLAAKELAGDQKLLKDAKKGSEVLIQKLRINNDMVQFGLTKIFFKSGIVANLELIRGDLMKKSAIMIQKHWKGMLCKQRYRKQRDAALLLQTLLRSTAAKKVCSDIVEEQSTLLLQTVIRSVLAAMEFNETVRAATLLQTAMRSSVAGEELRELNKNAAAVVLQDYIKLYQQQNYFKTLLFATTAAQARWRGKLARREYRQLRIEARSLSNVVAEKNKLETKVEELQYRLKAEQKIKEKEQEKLKSDVKQLRLQLDEKNAKLSESAQQVQSMSLRIKQLEEELEESNRLVQQAATSQAVTSQSARLAVEPTLAPPLIKRTDDYDKQHQRSTSPVASEGAPTTPNPTPTPSETSENIFDVVSSDEEVDEDDNDSLSEIELSPQLSSSRQHQQQLPPPQIIKVTDEKLEQEVLILREKDHTNQLEIDQLNKKIAELKHQLEHAAAAAVSTNNSRQSLSSSTSNLNTPLSPTNDPTSVRSISYKDFDQSITKDASPPAPRSRSPSVTVNGIPDLIAALEINNNQVGAGRFLIDNIVLKENLGFVNGTLPEPGFIFTRCFLEEVLTIGNPVKLEMAYYFVDSTLKTTICYATGSQTSRSSTVWLSDRLHTSNRQTTTVVNRWKSYKSRHSFRTW
ncbi:myosin [Heterostelium album PN500]|uniref:Myosin n=1 Tax=Heterostelium pallidum (strain ATCC 26659 / Pp 5 / PN500) TaxID=670386 RepID=D3BG45_HETP5|nr:myosin [Heterostelium album PN500]EFA79637.1 myosin [Heterostelium album PN500]|eukprot:XP_020431758.1 myosin [Heterostelium album PN500]